VCLLETGVVYLHHQAATPDGRSDSHGQPPEQGSKRNNGNLFDSLVTLTCWSLLKQRNARIFGNLSKQYSEDNLASWKT
jgi:hypothetical protein